MRRRNVAPYLAYPLQAINQNSKKRDQYLEDSAIDARFHVFAKEIFL